jgi:hypothetical protein
MAGQVSPGIVLRERDLTTSTIINTQANTAAFVGNFEKGPVGTITNISTEKELIEIFGKPNNNNYEDWFVAQTFLGYGGQLQVVRIENSALKNSVDGGGVAPTTDESKLYVEDASLFGSAVLVKVGNEYFFPDGVNTSGEDYIWVDARGVLGSSEVSHLVGSTVEAWEYSDSTDTTTIVESVDGTETVFDLNDSTGFAANDYVRVVDTVDNEEEIVKIVSVEEGNQVVVIRAQLGTTALVGSPNYTFTKLDFAATGTTTTLSQAYPVLTSGGSAPLIKSPEDFESNQSSYSWKFAAKTAGSWANGFKICTVDGTVATYATQSLYSGGPLWSTIVGDPLADDNIHVAILDSSNNIIETFTFLSKTPGTLDEQGASRYYIDVLNRKSSYVYAAAQVSAGNQLHVLSAGVDGYSTVVAEIEDAFDLFSDVENITIDFVLTGGSLANEANQVTKAQKAISVAVERKDCIAFVSPHNGFVNLSSTSAQRDDIIAFFNSVGNSTSYAVFDSGYKYVYDRFNDVYRYVPCNGDIAGLCVEVSANSEDWFSPAGNNRGNLRGVVKLAYVPTKTDRDKLYQARVNPIASFPGQGTVLFGDKTALSTPSAFDRINVRRLFLAVEKRVNQLAKNVLFELNDASTRSYFATAVTSYLSEVQAKRGVTDYLVVCDETNNTPDVIDRNEFVAEIYLKPSRSINYITLTFVATRTGVSFAEVVGR